MLKNKFIKVKVYRYDPIVDPAPRYEVYDVPIYSGMSAYNVLQYITENLDGSLSYYCSCRIGVCKGCMLRVNGNATLACSEFIEDDILFEPINEKNVIKDLLVELK